MLIRRIKRWLEWMYWVHKRDYSIMHYDDDDKKYKKQDYKKMTGKDIISSWWSYEHECLYMLLMHTEYCFYKLKNDGHVSWMYLDTVTKDEFSIAERYINWILDEEKRPIYIRHDGIDILELRKDGDTYKVEKLIQEKAGTMNVYDFDENGNIVEKQTDKFVTVRTETISFGNKWQDVLLMSDDLKAMLSNLHGVEVSVEDYPKLSSEAKNNVRGRRKDLKRLLEIRKIIKKLINAINEEGGYDWMKVQGEEHRTKAMYEAIDNYRKQRKTLYTKLADIMAEHGDEIWD